LRTRLLTVFALAAVLSALPAAAQRNPEGLSMPRTDLVKTTLTVGDTMLEVYARSGVDAGSLLAGVDRAKALQSEDLYRSIDVVRQKLYRDEPLFIVGTPRVPEKSKLVKYFYLWNDQSFQGEQWAVTCPTNGSTIAVLFVSLFDGNEDFYVKASATTPYKFIGTVDNDTYQYLTYSQIAKKKTTLGYAWDTISDSSGHIVAYCYQ
jgi:hypothetical protein